MTKKGIGKKGGAYSEGEMSVRLYTATYGHGNAHVLTAMTRLILQPLAGPRPLPCVSSSGLIYF